MGLDDGLAAQSTFQINELLHLPYTHGNQMPQNTPRITPCIKLDWQLSPGPLLSYHSECQETRVPAALGYLQVVHL